MAKRYIHLYFEDNEENRSEFGPLCKKVDKGWSMFVDYQRNGRGRKIRAKVLSVNPPRPESEDPFARCWLIHYDLGNGGAGWPLPECSTAHPGEMTHECRHDNLCSACKERLGL